MNVIEDNSKIKITQGTYREFVDFSKNRKRSKKSLSSNHHSSRNGSKGFAGTSSFEEALELANKGWDAGIEQLELEDGLLVEGNGMEVKENVCGSLVNIGNYVQGLPNNMYEFSELREYNLEPLTFYVSLNYSFANNLKKISKFTKSIINIINTYQAKHDIRIVGYFDLDFGVRSVTEVLIKDFGERFVINNIAYAFHSSFFRRLWFSVIEAEEFIYSGYGRQTSETLVNQRVLKQIKKSNEKAIILPRLDDLGSGIFDENQIIKHG